MMNKRIFFTLPVVVFALVLAAYQFLEDVPADLSAIRKQHALFLKEQAPKKDKGLSRLEKIKEGVPPNAYYEQMAYLTMNPALGYPEPYKVKELQEELRAKRKNKTALKAPGDSNEDSWRSRGPHNVGGRTRVLLFDPNDTTAKRVYAGAISGGLWMINDITKETSAWQQVPGLPSNLNISCITVDPRDKNTWYVGTGEQYTAGDVVGTGVFKTTDGGTTWSKVLDVKEFSTSRTGTAVVVGGTHFINDIEAWDNGSSTEIYIGVSTHIYANAENPLNFLGFYDRGLYRSTDGGDNWEQLLEAESFNDFEIDADGNLWAATTESPGEETPKGGKIYKKEKGGNTSFTLITTLSNVLRTEIEASATNPEKFYILTEDAFPDKEEADVWITTDAFNSVTKLNEPNDADYDITPTDFARGQAFYNLMVESDPNEDNIVYVGGIDLFRSTDSGETWQQISKWNDQGNLKNLPVSEVHADHHVMQFRPGNSNQAVFGHDGGVSFAQDLSSSPTSDVFINLDKDYITTQFYSVAVAPTSFSSGDYFLGGTQDNGTQLIENSNRESLGILGGDGAHSFYDQVNTEYLIANLVYNNLIITYNYKKKNIALIANNEDRDGFFINPQALDSNLDKLFSNGPEGTLYRYDNINDLETIGNEFDDGDPVAPRVSLTNSFLNTSISALTVSPHETSGSTVLAGLVNGRLLRLEKANGDPSKVTWENITGSQFVGSISDIEFGNSEAEIYVTFYNYGVKSVWYTKNALDANPTWENKEGNLPDLPVLAILPNPLNSQEVILGTELGVWSTADFQSSNPTWTQAYNGMSDVKVTDLDLKKGNNAVYAASYGRGIFSGQFKTGTPGGEGAAPQDAVVISPTVSEGIYFLSSQKEGAAIVHAFDLQGQLVYSSSLQLGNNIPEQVDLSGRASGIYFIKIIHAGKEQVEKVIRK